MFNFTIRVIYCLPLVFCSISTAYALELEEIALECRTDKGPGIHLGSDRKAMGHNYARIYEKYFSSLKNKPLQFLEIGFAEGNSARMWERYFPNATFHFIDIIPTLFRQFGHGLTRSSFYVADQASKDQLEQVMASINKKFDVIIDDGGHEMHQQIVSFLTLFPYVKEGGMYVIEDLHTSYHLVQDKSKITANENTTIRLLQSLVDEVNFYSVRNWCADFKKCPQEIINKMSHFQKYIESVHFYGSLCFILKRSMN